MRATLLFGLFLLAATTSFADDSAWGRTCTGKDANQDVISVKFIAWNDRGMPGGPYVEVDKNDQVFYMPVAGWQVSKVLNAYRYSNVDFDGSVVTVKFNDDGSNADVALNLAAEDDEIAQRPAFQDSFDAVCTQK